jgi:hypothetical protein
MEIDRELGSQVNKTYLMVTWDLVAASLGNVIQIKDTFSTNAAIISLSSFSSSLMSSDPSGSPHHRHGSVFCDTVVLEKVLCIKKLKSLA